MKVLTTAGLTKLIQLIKSSFIKTTDTVTTNTVTLAEVATSGDYDDLTNKPTIPTVNNATLTITQGGTTKGTFTANASSDVTIALDAGGGSSDVFIADYGVTTYSEITSAINNGKTIFCKHIVNSYDDVNITYGMLSQYAYIDGSTPQPYTFNCVDGSSNLPMTVTSSDVWSEDYIYFATTSAIPTSISDLTDDTSTTPIDKADTLTGLTASIAELNYTDGVTSNIQTQLDGKADTDLTNLISTASKNFDGVWVSSQYDIITSNTTFGADSDHQYSLSSYLPNDNYVYEVYYSIAGETGTASGNNADISIHSAFFPSVNRVARAKTRSSSSVTWCGSGTVLIGTDRSIGARNLGSDVTVNYFRIFAYRRMGTNE